MLTASAIQIGNTIHFTIKGVKTDCDKTSLEKPANSGKERQPCGENNKRITKLLGQYRGYLINTGFGDIAYKTIDEIDTVVAQLRKLI